MKNIFVILALVLLISTASAVVELSGTDPAIFDQPMMTKDGIRTQISAEVWGTPNGWNNAADGTPFGDKTPLLVGSLAKAAGMGMKAIQTETYLDNAINFSDNLTIIDDLNVTEGNESETKA